MFYVTFIFPEYGVTTDIFKSWNAAIYDCEWQISYWSLSLATQEAVAQEIMADFGVDDVPLVGVAKGPDRDARLERFFLPGKTPFMLEPKSPVLYYLQRLRDEAHRFAIGTHRAKRSAEMLKNPLDEIDGVGPARKKALLHAFGSARGVSRASVQDLAKVEGLSEPLAQRIHDHFRRG